MEFQLRKYPIRYNIKVIFIKQMELYKIRKCLKEYIDSEQFQQFCIFILVKFQLLKISNICFL